jgi:hypothetical protein
MFASSTAGLRLQEERDRTLSRNTRNVGTLLFPPCRRDVALQGSLWGALRHAAAREHVKQPGQDVGVPGVEAASKVPKQGRTSPPALAAGDGPPTHTGPTRRYGATLPNDRRLYHGPS